MDKLILDIVNSYENRVSMVEELVTGEYYSTTTLDASLVAVADERTRLKASLQEILTRNSSLRRKDFSTLMERITSEFKEIKSELEEEGESVREGLKRYLGEQKQSVTSLRQQLVDFACEKVGRDAVEATMTMVKTAYRERGQEMSATLRNFQLRLEFFQAEQEEINHKLQRLEERGESLRLEDLRQLEATKDGQERRAERKLRQQKVERLLAHFKEQRQ